MAGGMTLSSEPTTPTGHVFGADAGGRICSRCQHAERSARGSCPGWTFLPDLDALPTSMFRDSFIVLQEKHVLDSRHMVGGFFSKLLIYARFPLAGETCGMCTPDLRMEM